MIIQSQCLSDRSLRDRTSQLRVNSLLLATLLSAAMVAICYAIEAVIGYTSESLAMLVAIAAFCAAWYGGFWAGTLTTLLGSCYFVVYFCVVRYNSIGHDANHLIEILMPALCGIVGSTVYHNLREDRRRADVAAESERLARCEAETWQGRYNAAVKASRSVLYDCNRITTQVVYGGDCEGVLGYAATELNGDISKWISLIYPDDRPRFLQGLNQAIAACTNFQTDYRMIRKDGSIVWMRDDGYFADEQTSDRPIHAIGFVRDVTGEKRAEERLRLNEERLTTLLEQLPVGVGVIGLDGIVVQSNPIMLHYVPKMAASLDPERRHRWQAWKPDESRLPPEEWPAMRALRGEQVVPGTEFLFTEDDGQQVWIKMASSPLKGGDGTVVGAISVIEDINVRKKAEVALRRSDELNRSLMNGITDCVYVLNTNGRLLMTNDPGMRLAEIDTPETLYGKDWAELWPPETMKDAHLSVEAAAGGGVYTFEAFCSTSKGTPKWWEVTTSPVQESSGGRIGRLLAIARDITGRREIDLQLKESERRFRAVIEHQYQFTALLTPDARIVVVSGSALRNAGVSHEAIIGMPFLDAPWFRRLPDVQETWRRQFEEAVAGTSSHIEVPFNVSDGSVRWSINTVSAIRNDEGTVEYLLAEGIDITERKLTEDKLKESDRKKDEFLATLAHELRNPLASIRYALKIMSLARGNLDAVEKAVGTVDRQAGHMARLIDDLMDLSRISRGGVTLQKTKLLIADILQDAIDFSRPLIDERGHDFVLKIPPELLYVDGDRTRLVQVLYNLLTNATNYTEKRGQIQLVVEQQGDDVVIAVEDTGVGIPADMLNKVFDMFTRVNQRQPNALSGLGIGLNIARRLVDMHNGSIAAESDGRGKGSRFTVRLPLVKSTPEASSGGYAISSGNKHTRRRILVVDDDRNVADGLAEILRITGHDTQTAYGGHEAIAAAEAFQPDMILMDIGMPVLNGYEACRQIREKPWGKRIMIVAHSGWGTPSDKQKTVDAGFDCHVVKSADPAYLDGLLEKLELKMTDA